MTGHRGRGERRWYDPFTGAPGGSGAAGPADDPAPTGVPRPPLPERIGDAAAELVDARDWSRRLEGARIHALWARIAGPTVAAHVQPVRLLGGVLVLRADSGAWATQVRYLTGDLAERVNAELGEGTVSRITVTT